MSIRENELTVKQTLEPTDFFRVVTTDGYSRKLPSSAVTNLKGVSGIEKTGTSGLVDTYTITYTNGDTDTFEVTNGAEGNGISSIEKTDTSGNVDTYTITYTNGQTTTFTVTNGSVTSVDGKTGDVTLDDKANIDGYYEDLTAGYAENLISNVFEEDSVPYNFRTSGRSLDIGAFEYDEIVGGSLPVNQLINIVDSSGSDNGLTWTFSGGVLTVNGTASADTTIQFNTGYAVNITPNHKYAVVWTGGGSSTTYQLVNGTTGGAFNNSSIMAGGSSAYGTNIRLKVFSGASISNKKFTAFITDLTLMFGTTIADYIYTLETGQAGAGVAWFKKLFPKSYYPYNAGELMHVQTSGHKMVGFNQWDEEWEEGAIVNGNNVSASCIRSKNYIPVFPSTTYYLKTAGQSMYVSQYDADKNWISPRDSYINTTFTTKSNTHFIRFNMPSAYGTTYNHDICINLHWDGERDGEYEAYEEHTYPLDSSLTLRGIPKLDASNNLYYDGDTYEADGTVTRKYGVVDLGTVNWSSFVAGQKLLYVNMPMFKGVASNNDLPNIIGTKYITITRQSVGYGSTSTATGVGIDVSKNLYVVDNSGAWDNVTNVEEAKATLNGVYLVYELATPTTETADPFQNPQAVSNWGTEEYIDGRTIPIPVGHNTEYPADLKAKVETSPNPPDADGDYLVRHVNGTNEYVALSSNSTIQNIISRLEALEA